MPNTLMRRATFNKLAKVRSALVTSRRIPAGIFVPWAGSRLRTEGGIYYVGMATRGNYYSSKDDPQTFAAQLKIA